jgi:diguanylate cyclase (GGDEF)-like protein/PAS domain S-box-containing protein
MPTMRIAGPFVDYCGRNRTGSEDDIVVAPADAARRTRSQFDPALLAGLIEHLPGAVYRCEAELPRRVIHLSEQIEELTGHEAEAFRTDRVRWTDLIHPDDRDAVKARLAADLAASGRFSVEYRIFHRGGEIRWVRDQGKIVRGVMGEPILEGFIQDDSDRKRTECALRAGQAELSTVFKQALVGILHSDREGNVISLNDAACRMLGRSAAELTRLPLFAPLLPDDAAEQIRNFKEKAAAGDPYSAERRYVHPDGSIVWCEIQVSFVRGENDEVESAIALMLDITRRREVDEQRTQAIEMLKCAEEAARAGEALNLSIIEASADCIALLDVEGRLTFMNGHGLAAAGVADFALLAGRKWAECWPAPVRPSLDQAIEAAREGGVGRFTGSSRSADGTETWWDVAITPVRGEASAPDSLLAISRDVTEQRRSVERVRWAAGHDAMTGLPNRRVFQERLQNALEDAAATGHRAGLLVLDIDNLKEVNDDRGHDAGDALLRVFSERLRLAVRSTDTVARLGGDEFAVILHHLSDRDDVAAIITPILERLQIPFHHLGKSLDCRASVGAAVYPDQGETPDELMKNADLALYAAKLSHRGSMTMFAPDMRAEMQNRISMLNLARDAIRQGLIEPFYQPKVNLRTGKLAGFEALLRWRHPNLGVQAPATIAEAFGDVELASQIGERMQERVFADMRRWLDRGLQFHHVAINTSGAEFRKDDFAEQLLARLQRAGVPPELVEVEITEKTAFLGKNSEYVVRALEVLRAHRVRVALDDFGTGFSSLSHLKDLPVDVLKIDQSFVRDIAGTPDSDDAAIVLAVLNLGRSLNLEVVAEGIEQESQAAFLRANGCDTGQGYLFGKAVPAAQVPGLMEARRRGARPKGRIAA